jgi:hypothetical protein
MSKKIIRAEKGSSLAAVIIVLALVAIVAFGASKYLQQKPTMPTKSKISEDSKGEMSLEDINTSDLMGKDSLEITRMFGDPTAKTSDNTLTKEIWVYQFDAMDSTGLYLYLQNDVVIDTKKDEYNGTFEAETWLNE